VLALGNFLLVGVVISSGGQRSAGSGKIALRRSSEPTATLLSREGRRAEERREESRPPAADDASLAQSRGSLRNAAVRTAAPLHVVPESGATGDGHGGFRGPTDTSFLLAQVGAGTPKANAAPLSQWHYSEYFGILPILEALDANDDLEISRLEIEEAATTLKSLDADGNLVLDARECGFELGAAEKRLDRAGVEHAEQGFMTFHRAHRVLDANGDRAISLGEMEAAPERLTALDANGDGKLDGEELLPEPVDNQAARIMRLDRNRDGEISAGERGGRFGDRLQNFLNSADRDRNLVITTAEVHSEVRRRSDLNGDGAIGREEVLRALKSGAFDRR